jgi:hypothetical protein
MVQDTAYADPDERDDALEKIIQDEELDPETVSPEQRRRQYDEQEGKERGGIPRPSEDGDDFDDEDTREP